MLCVGEKGGRVFEGSSSETLVISHSTIADELNLRYARDGLEVRMKNRLGCGLGLVVAFRLADRKPERWR